MRNLSFSLAVTGILVLASSASAQTLNAFVGTWKLDVAKSTLAGPAPRSAAVNITPATGEFLKVTVDSVGADGTAANWGYTTAPDGTESPVMGNPGVDTVSGSQVSAREVASTSKKAGKVISTLKGVVSSDGKTLTITTTPAGPGAEPSVEVYTKQ